MEPSHPSAGAVIGGKYRIERVLGEGGMGAVFEAVHVRLDQRVAIKMLLPSLVKVGELVWRFEREAKAAAQLRHRNTARVVDVDVTPDGVPYMVMELLHGHDLESELQTRGALPIGEAVHHVLQACSAMGEAHGLGIVHRDLKPANLFLNEEADGSVCLKVLDFGISKVQSDSDVRVTTTKAQMGTPLYMSPEQVRSAKNVDLRCDVWSLGVILYELLAGEPPFTGSAAGIGAAIVNDAPPPLRARRPEVPEALEAAISKAMAKNPADRFASTVELAAALAPFSSVPVAAGAPSLPRVGAASLPRVSSPSSPSIAVAATLAAPTTDAPRPEAASSSGATAGTWAGETKATARPRRVWMAGAVAGIAAAALVGAAGISLSRGGTGAAVSATSASGLPATSTPTSTSKSPSLASSLRDEELGASPPTSTSTSTSTATSPPTSTATSPPTSTPTATSTAISVTTARPTATAHPTATTKPSTSLANPPRL